MDEVVTDVGGSFPASNGGISRTAHVPGRAPGGSPPKNRNGGSGMSRGQKAKPPPVKVDSSYNIDYDFVLIKILSFLLIGFWPSLVTASSQLTIYVF